MVTSHAEHNPLVMALRECGAEVLCQPWPPRRAGAISQREWQDWRLGQAAAYYGNLFVEIKAPLRFMALLRFLRARQIPYLFWNRDAPWNTGIKPRRRLLARLLRPVDIYLAHSPQTADLFSASYRFFPNAAPSDHYQSTDLARLRDERRYCYDVSFIGALSGNANAQKRSQFLTALRAQMLARAPALRIEWRDTSKAPVNLTEQLHLVRGSKVNLNLGAVCDLPDEQSFGVPERVFGIPAAGGLVISEARQTLPLIFPPDLCPSFTSVSECCSLILNMLDNFVALRTLAEAQHRHVLAHHTYVQRARKVLALIAEYRRPKTYA